MKTLTLTIAAIALLMVPATAKTIHCNYVGNTYVCH